jgi:TetR/AcrR family transcriptional regulator, transcriptional repressor for nem operon
MGHSQADKARTHERIVEIASRRLREEGLDGIGLAELMQEAGLTVGGFYKHFGSRDALVAEAVAAGFASSNTKIETDSRSGAAPSLAAFVDAYLSPAHRDDPGGGCTFAALGSDLARSDERTRDLTTAQIRRSFARIASLVNAPEGRAEETGAEGAGAEETGAEGAGTREASAILVFSALIGALSLARIVTDEGLSGTIMESVRQELLDLFGKKAASPEAAG